MAEDLDAMNTEAITDGAEAVATIDWVEGEQLGPYVLRGSIGGGGMGMVFMADQLEPIQRTVAVKIIQLGMDTKGMLARFEAERQILALLDHPNVATILDAGSTEKGRPYFVMELVSGVRIDTFADVERLGIHERIELFIQVLAGVEHAHQKGVIHRDLKPTNILATKQNERLIAKIIDFGIAKSMTPILDAEGTLTRAGDFVGTPRYMSPEQATLNSNELDVRTDVFSLGVVLYELLVGLSPFAQWRSTPTSAEGELSRRSAEHPSKRLKSSREVDLDKIVERRRLSPESLRKVFSGDLSNILLKATETDRNQRYRNVAEFADDLRRYLDGYPVQARPRSALYTLSKFAQRHKALVATVAVAVAAMIGLAGLATAEFFRAERNAAAAQAAAAQADFERANAEREAETAARVSQFLISVFDTAAPGEVADADITVREALDRALPTIESSLTGDPVVRARVLLAVGNVLASLDRGDEALPLFADALAIARSGADEALLVDALIELSEAERAREQDEAAEVLASEALTIDRRRGVADPRHARALQSVAYAILPLDRREEAIALFEEAMAIWEEQAPDSDGHLETLQGLALAWDHHTMLRRTGLAYLEQVAAMYERKFGAEHHETAIVYRNLSGAHAMIGPLEKALEHSGAAVEIFEVTVGDEHRDTLFALNWRARIQLSLGDFEGALATAGAITERTDAETGGFLYPWAMHTRAIATFGLGRHDDLLELLAQTDVDQLGGIQKREAAMAQAFSLTALGRRDEGIALLQAVQPDFERLHLAEMLWAEAAINADARERLCREGAGLLEDPRAQIGPRSEILVYGQHARLRRCIGELDTAAELEQFMRDEKYVDLFAHAAEQL
ncbi:MAG: serine/threonine-protein kinase [Pseudomonadota bacterium]